MPYLWDSLILVSGVAMVVGGAYFGLVFGGWTPWLVALAGAAVVAWAIT